MRPAARRAASCPARAGRRRRQAPPHVPTRLHPAPLSMLFVLRAGKKWCRIVDTNLPPPRDFTPGGNAGVGPSYGLQAYSSILLVAKDAA